MTTFLFASFDASSTKYLFTSLPLYRYCMDNIKKKIKKTSELQKMEKIKKLFFKNNFKKVLLLTRDGTRTHTAVKPPDFESSMSTNFITLASNNVYFFSLQNQGNFKKILWCFFYCVVINKKRQENPVFYLYFSLSFAIFSAFSWAFLASLSALICSFVFTSFTSVSSAFSSFLTSFGSISALIFTKISFLRSL